MPSTKNHHVIEAFSPNRADQSLGKGILPGTAGCGDDFFYSQRLYAAAKPVAVNRVAIPDQVMLASRSEKASTTCCAVHSAVGCSVTPKCRTLLLSCSRTRNTNSTRNRIVGTVKKSIATISPR